MTAQATNGSAPSPSIAPTRTRADRGNNVFHCIDRSFRIDRKIVILATAVGSFLFWGLRQRGSVDTAATYIGLPALRAVILALTPRSRSTTGVTIKGVTVALILSGLILGPGVVCILVSAPIFFLFAIAVSSAFEPGRDGSVQAPFVVAIMAGLATEGVLFTTDTHEVVTQSRVIDMTGAAFAARLASPPKLDHRLPFILRLGFPAPTAAGGEGLALGTERRLFLTDRNIHFTLLGKSGRVDGEVAFRVAARGDEWVRFDLVRDESHVAKWLTWRSTHVRWRELPNDHLLVTWEVSYERKLDPGWYFGPILRFGVQQTVGAMIDMVAAGDG